ncbi:MAG: hypothetical protein M1297_04005 [Nitrospirae bacterium]|jgi:hypothetical protein|nr:hypothetical protein [Nitrospirota bacterium]
MVDWKDVQKAVEKGQALAHYREACQESLPEGDSRKGVPYVSFWREYRRKNGQTFFLLTISMRPP